MPEEKKKILVVEDEGDFRASLRMRLESAGYRVLEAGDGDTGLRMALEHLPDLVILDLMLPQVTGYNVARLLKDNLAGRHIPIVMLTARAQSTEKEIGFAVGADAYLVKPCPSDDLLATVSGLLRE